MDQIVLGLQGAYLGIGCVFAAYIISRTWWDHWKTALPGAVIALAMVWLWLPALIVIGLLILYAFWAKGRRASRRHAKSLRNSRNFMMAIRQKHNVDDEAVTARVIDTIKEGTRG